MRWIIGCVLIICLVPMFPRGRSLQFADMKEGSISTRRIVAPFNFEILKTDDEVRRDREIATQKIYPLFRRDLQQSQEISRQIDAFFQQIRIVRTTAIQSIEAAEALEDSLFRQYPISVLDTLYRDALISPESRINDERLIQFRDNLKKIVRDLLAVGVLDVEKATYMNPDRRLIIVNRDEEVSHTFDEFYDLHETRIKATEQLNTTYPDAASFAQMGFGVVNFFIRPNLLFDDAMYQERLEEARARVPLSSGFVAENEKIVDRNERITPEVRRKLLSLATKMAELGVQEGGVRRIFPLAGKVLFTASLLAVLIVFLVITRIEILSQTKSVLLLALTICLMALFTFLLHTFLLPRFDAAEYLVPTAFGTMLLTILFDERIGYAGTAVLSVLLGGLWGNEFNLMAVSFFVGIVGVVAIKRVRGRRQLMQAIFLLMGAYIISITMMGFLRIQPMNQIIRLWPYGMLNGLLTPIIAYGLLPLIESGFDITTQFSLLELSNLNHPLLKRLSMEASGTYHHSIIVGNLAEAAAHTLGANSLLARVGSYYHDVGKMEKAEYFVENQNRGENPHEKLTPRMSALILMNHVKKGLEMADKYKLPLAIKDIIVQHHGTSVMSFFYKKALDVDSSSEVQEHDFRYPGPRPQSKEAAIVMLADTVEAATRSLKQPTHNRIKGLIDELVDERFRLGQLDESPLTLRDLEQIKESFLNILAGTFHARVEYPDRIVRTDGPDKKSEREDYATD